MYIQTEISKEVHRNLFIHWTSKFAEKKDEYVYILREEEEDDDQLQQILNDYSSIGLPGCIGSVYCVHIGWNRCPAYQKNFTTSSKYNGNLHTSKHVHLNGAANPISNMVAKGMLLLSCVFCWSFSRHCDNKEMLVVGAEEKGDRTM